MEHECGTPWLTIGCGDTTYMQDEAEEVLAGFAFGTAELNWSPPTAVAGEDELARPPRAAERSKWSYRAYDCLPNSPYAFEVGDLLAVAALDAGVDGAKFLAMEAILPDLNEVLAQIDIGRTFWALNPAWLGAVPRVPPVPPAGTTEWWLWRAWALLRGLSGVGPTITHKVLHHKRPWLFPIVDTETVNRLSKCGGEWQTLHAELTNQVDQFKHLEQWFAGQAIERGGMLVTRLRIHDILLWADVKGQRGALKTAGRKVLG
jgi:hypothetical protein